MSSRSFSFEVFQRTNKIINKSLRRQFNVTLKNVERLGVGKFGEVYRVKDPKTGEELAVKIIKKTKLKDWMDRAFMETELNIHPQLKHPFIVKFHNAFEDRRCHYMVLELMAGGELFDRIAQDNSFCERKAALITRHVAEALNYMHEKNIVHRDLKPENLLLADKEDESNLKLADFGMAAKCEEPLTTPCGTLTYIAPEVLLSNPYKTEIDIWSLGIILFMMLSGVPPFFGNNDEETMRRIVKGRLGFIGEGWEQVSDEAKQLVEKMLTRDQEERITAAQILETDWVKNAEQTSDEALSQVAVNMRKFKAKQLLKAAFNGLKAVENLRNIAKNFNFEDFQSEEMKEEQKSEEQEKQSEDKPEEKVGEIKEKMLKENTKTDEIPDKSSGTIVAKEEKDV